MDVGDHNSRGWEYFYSLLFCSPWQWLNRTEFGPLELELQKLLLKVTVSKHFLCLVFFIKPLLLALIDTIRRNFCFLYSWSYSSLKVTLRCIHHRGIELKGLREVNFSTIGVLPMGRSNHPWLNFNDCSFKGHGKAIKQSKRQKPVVNTPRSLDFPVVKTPGSSDKKKVLNPW